MKNVLLFMCFIVVSITVKAQLEAFGTEAGEGRVIEHPPFIKPEINSDHVMRKLTIWRRVDFKEKQNRAFFSKGAEISRLLIDAVMAGKIRAYRSDSCKYEMKREDFTAATQIEMEGSTGDMGFSDPFGVGGVGAADTDADADADAAKGIQYTPIPQDLFNVAYFKEDLIFDKNRSKQFYFIRVISIALPASAGVEWNPAGFEKKIAHFKYDEVVQLFRKEIPRKAIYFNNANQGAHLNMSDALELRLFNAPIVRVSNTEHIDIRQEFGELIAQDPINALIIQEKYEQKIVNDESVLWEN